MNNTKLDQSQIDLASELIAKIGFEFQTKFLTTVNTEDQVVVKVFGNEGVYFSRTDENYVTINIAFIENTDLFNDEITELIHQTVAKTESQPVHLWIYKKNTKVIEHLIAHYDIQPSSGESYYASIEFIMRRENFQPKYLHANIDMRPYEEEHIDTYLDMIDDTNFFSGFSASKEYLMKDFEAYAKKNHFEAFWVNDELVGLYWLNDLEIDMLAVSAKHQGKGYGNDLLTRAIERTFETTDLTFADLYVVDYNPKAQAFYRKYGMEVLGQPFWAELPNIRGDVNGEHKKS